jgi:hypothetical protein
VHTRSGRNGDVRRAIGGPAVDDDHLVDQGVGQLADGPDDGPNGVRLVQRREDDADGGVILGLRTGEVIDAVVVAVNRPVPEPLGRGVVTPQ